jgi:iron complex outermembrane receptor protein
VRKPYFNLDPAGRFTALGDVINRGFEASISGPLTPELSLVAGAVLLDPVVTGDAVARGLTGPRPVGAIRRRVEAGADWRPGFAPGLSFDISLSHASRQIATVANDVSIPARTLVGAGGRYAFKLGRNPAVLRVQISNIGDFQGWELRGAGAYDLIEGQLLSAYLTVDF